MNPQEPAPSLAKRMWVRFAFAGLIIVAFSAAATATAGLLEVKDLSEQLHPSGKAPIKVPELTPVEKGPQTILLMGSDVRKIDRQRGLKGNSDTMILVRLDPTKKATALLSIPRDLKARLSRATAPQKINAAFPEGGTRLTVKTIQENLPGIQINHVVNTNFKGFQALVNKVGCVYVDIDRRYFNDNAIAYATIDVKPGYQKMCGSRRARLRPLPPRGHRPGSRGAPAGLHPPGAQPGRREEASWRTARSSCGCSGSTRTRTSTASSRP